MKTIWPIAISVSFLVHTGIIFGVQFDRAQKLKENALTNELLSREIEIIAHDTLKDNKLNETGSDIKVPPYISNKSFKKIMTANNTLADIAKPDIMEENIKEIILSEIPNDKRLRENPDGEPSGRYSPPLTSTEESALATSPERAGSPWTGSEQST
ncbi:MAG: hypothetical protein PHP69_05035, partial [Candidatus Omnitrophica bacterium]|nr:hypothetical protein [Candidatus Omnitrophota bacterium]